MALPDRLRQLAAKVSNAGRWGPDDQRGTLNLIDAAAVARGVAAARQGRALGGRPVGWGSQGGPSRMEANPAALRDDVAEYFSDEISARSAA